ncbi:MTRF1L release factor glutamine methyltransferase [Biomphalaria glabrata]|nr:MTRF1L release factor glutamine methyltransferase [Biomphalaria glabrata]
MSHCSCIWACKQITKAILSRSRSTFQKRVSLNFTRCYQPPRSVGFSSCLTESATQKLEDVYKYWSNKFLSHNIGEADVSANYIVAHVLGHKTIYNLDAHTLLNQTQVDKINELCHLRLTGMPVQYVIGEWDFLDLTLTMRPPVLIPRPETEELALLCIETLLNDIEIERPTVLEIGCGSGALSLSLLKKCPKLQVVAVDISPTACSLTQENARSLGLMDRICVIQGDFTSDKVQLELSKLSAFPLIVSNPPYLTTDELTGLQSEIKCFEDPTALDGGLDGLDIIKEIILKAPDLLMTNGHLWMEVSHQQPPLIAKLVRDSHNDICLIEVVKDLFGKDRFCHFQKNETTKREIKI